MSKDNVGLECSKALFGHDNPPLSGDEFARLFELHAKKMLGRRLSAGETLEFSVYDSSAHEWCVEQRLKGVRK